MAARVVSQPSIFAIPSTSVDTIIIPMTGNPAALARVCRKWRTITDETYVYLFLAYKKHAIISRFTLRFPTEMCPRSMGRCGSSHPE